jgi:hypothetical protein
MTFINGAITVAQAATFSSSVQIGSTSGGGVLTTANGGTNAIFQSFQNTGGTSYIGLEQSAGGDLITGSTGYDLVFRGTSGIGFSANNGASVNFRIASTGAATFSSSVTATSFFESSSIKGKDIIATNPLLALNIDVIKYTRKNDESKDIRYGYSAEQIHSLMPELTDKDVTAVKYLDVHTILISQLQKEIKELKAKLN